MHRLALVALASVALFACQARAQHTSPDVEGADYAVHEWGVQRFIGPQAELSTSATTPRYDDMMIEKPIIYFHPGASWDPDARVSATIALTNGRLRELWPLRPGDALTERYTWDDIALGADCSMQDVPSGWVFPCTTLTDGGICETAEMHDYMRTPESCVRVGEQPTPALLYNGYVGATRPITIDARAHTVTNISPEPIGPLWIPISRDALQAELPAVEEEIPTEEAERRMAWSSLVRVRVDTIAPGETVAFGTLEALEHDAFMDQLRADLVAHGLTTNEAADLERAWATSILAAYETPVPIGFYAQSRVEQLYPLTLTPAPREVHRVLLFTIE